MVWTSLNSINIYGLNSINSRTLDRLMDQEIGMTEMASSTNK